MNAGGPELEIAAAYDGWAEVYDTDRNRTRDLAAAVLRRSPLTLRGRDVVEIGCGTGANTAWLAEHAASVLVLDFSPKMLRRAEARVRSSRARFVRHDVRAAWPAATGSADVVIAMLVLEHVEHLPPVFTESGRVLRRDGELFLCELHPARQWQGHRAEYTHPKTGEAVRVAAFLHETSEYVTAGRQAGFELLHLGEWRDRDSPRTALPRLLSVHLRRRRGG